MKLAIFSLALLPLFAQADWLQFRGPNGNGVAEGATATAPLLGEGAVRWKTNLPGRGLSSPIVVGPHIYLTASSGTTQERLHLLCFTKADGKLAWEREFAATGRTMCHEKTNVAAPTGCSDGKQIFVQFSSNDVASFSLEGDLLWMRGLTSDYPNASNSLGMASSLAVARGTLVVMVENDSDSFSVGLEATTGKNLWKLPRKKIANWSSPVLGGKPEQPFAVLLSSDGAAAVDVATGSELWKAPGGTTTPSACITGDVMVTPANGVTAYKLAATGAPQELWKSAQLSNGTASPVVWKNRVLCINNGGVLGCGDLADGSVKWKLRLEGPFSGSPIVVGDKLVAVNEAGVVQVVSLDAEKEPAAAEKLSLGETVLCTPAFDSGSIYLRSDKTLWKLGG
jgi:outer membrane protein assembly factor BamB